MCFGDQMWFSMNVQGPALARRIDDLRVVRGSKVPAGAAISVVVMATDAPPTVRAAVQSLLAQDGAVEIIVVNTGNGSVRDHLAAEEDFITWVETKRRRYPGGTRNLGIKYSSGPIVAFLAADCLATPGWVQKRLAAHRAGSKAVASALLPAPEDGKNTAMIVAWACYAAMHWRRMPDMPAERTTRYGASYRRELFEEFGLFREDLRVSEDTEFNRRIGGAHKPVWDPEIVTLHRYPSTLPAALKDQFVRGRRSAAWQLHNKATTPARVFLAQRKTRVRWPKRYVRNYGTGARRDAILRARHLLPLLALAFGVGALSLYLSMPAGGGANSDRTR